MILFFTIWCFFQAGGTTSPAFKPAAEAPPRIDIEMRRADLRRLRRVPGERVKFYPRSFLVNDRACEVKRVRSRGNSTLDYPEKSLNVTLKEPAPFLIGGDTIRLKKFYLLNLTEDEHFIHNHFCFGLLRQLELFPLPFSFVDFRINGQAQGPYLMVQKPQTWAETQAGSPCVIRRTYTHGIDKLKGKGSRSVRTECAERFNRMYRVAQSRNLPGLYDSLHSYLHPASYFTWLAFNYLVANGDYADEAYFYTRPDDPRFRLLPWDYDDVFTEEPHEGAFARSRLLGDQLLFSAEDGLDRAIGRDSACYAAYERTLVAVARALTDALIETEASKTRRELAWFYDQPGHDRRAQDIDAMYEAVGRAVETLKQRRDYALVQLSRDE